MKKSLLIIGSIVVVALAGLFLYTTFKNNEIKSIVRNLDNSPYMKQLKFESDVKISSVGNVIKIKVKGEIDGAKVDKGYHLTYENEQFKIVVEDGVDYFVYKSILGAVFKSLGYEYSKIDEIDEKDNYSLSKAGVEIQETDNKMEYTINVSKRNKIVEDKYYLSTDYLRFNKLDRLLNDSEVFVIKRGEIVVVKTANLENQIVYIIDEGDDNDDNVYKTVRAMVPLILDASEIKSFEKEYTLLKDFKTDHIEIITDYKIQEGEMISEDPADGKITKIMYSLDKDSLLDRIVENQLGKQVDK